MKTCVVVLLSLLATLSTFGQIRRGLELEYDDRGRLERITHAHGKVQTFTYNRLTGHVTVTYDGRTIISDTDYDDNAQIHTLTFASRDTFPGAEITRDYDNLGRIEDFSLKVGGSEVYRARDYEYDEWMLLESYRRADASRNHLVEFSYGSRGELERVEYGSNRIDYTWDARGNLTARDAFRDGILEGPELPRITYNSDNQRNDWGYDAAGRLVRDDRFVYVYDAFEMVSQVLDKDDPLYEYANYLHDAAGNRVRTIVGDKAMYDIRLPDGRLATREIHQSGLNGPEVYYQDFIYHNAHVVAVVTWDSQNQPTIQYQFRQVLGTPIATVDEADGFVIEYHEYDPFGVEHSTTDQPSTDTPHRFSGKERDGAAGLDHFDARYYASNYGRFLRPDPAYDFDPVSPFSYNLYGYTRGDPVNHTDTTGEIVETAWDIANVTMGVASFRDNYKKGNFWGMVIDGAGIVVDTVATALPVVPAGSSSIIKGIRAADKVVDSKRVFLSADEFGSLASSGNINPNKIRFSQNNISPKFQNGGQVSDLAKALASGKVDPASINPIRIVERDGKIFTLDNRRLKAFQDAGVDIPFIKLHSIPRNERFKFTTVNDGISIDIRK